MKKILSIGSANIILTDTKTNNVQTINNSEQTKLIARNDKSSLFIRYMNDDVFSCVCQFLSSDSIYSLQLVGHRINELSSSASMAPYFNISAATIPKNESVIKWMNKHPVSVAMQSDLSKLSLFLINEYRIPKNLALANLHFFKNNVKSPRLPLIFSTSSTHLVVLKNNEMLKWNNPTILDKANSVLPNTFKKLPIAPNEIKSVCTTSAAYCIETKRGDIVAWGQPMEGGNTPVISKNTSIQKIISNNGAFALLYNNGTIQSWGHHRKGGSLPELPKDKKVFDIHSNQLEFFAHLETNEIVKWSTSSNLIIETTLPDGEKIESWHSNSRASVILLKSGRVHTWGNELYGGISPTIPEERSVISITKNDRAFVAHLDDKTIVTWGNLEYGGAYPDIQKDAKVLSLIATNNAFSAHMEDDKIVSWGQEAAGGITPNLEKGIKVVSIRATNFSFTGILSNKKIITWGRTGLSENESIVPDKATIKEVFSTGMHNCAILNDNRLVFWGEKLNSKMKFVPFYTIIDPPQSGPVKAIIPNNKEFLLYVSARSVYSYNPTLNKLVDLPIPDNNEIAYWE
ncbi:hypothetical protein HOG98_01455 [bacterium]|jgi:hypothetical protein|nr:hypothetical protein [bacterium]